ncbi:uncharacterized protein [Pocillopora verrucosa]|uniref:uncharacterized protein n=1 Tax=Pocillopora verrucosa TaxID=203993 RepID=UPI00333E5CE9
MNDEKYSCHDVHRDVLYVLVLAEFCMEVFDGEFQHITEWMYLNGTRVPAQLPIKLHVESATNVVAQVNTKQLADRNRDAICHRQHRILREGETVSWSLDHGS